MQIMKCSHKNTIVSLAQHVKWEELPWSHIKDSHHLISFSSPIEGEKERA